MIHPGDRAFPDPKRGCDMDIRDYEKGMSTRTYIATQLMGSCIEKFGNDPDVNIARIAVEYANALINELNK